jgi:hypothetical protein
MMSETDDTKSQAEGALAEVRKVCEAYDHSAELVGTGIFSDDDLGDFAIQHYAEGRNKAVSIAIAITDKGCRDKALQAALNFCMKAKDLDFAVMIVKAIDIRTIQEEIVKAHGEYFTLDEKDGRLLPTSASAIDPSLE